ncbi:MAG: response regulator [Spirochaetales bacterium]|nr:response regulator [Spirochaetales bacterium]
MLSANPVILLVEDSYPDRKLIKEILKEHKLETQLYEVEDGSDALKFLHNEAPFEDAPKPQLIILDLNLIRVHGYEVLPIIKNDPVLKSIPVIVFTSADDAELEYQLYKDQASCYIVKPGQLDEYMQVVESLGHFWGNLAQLPKS